MAKRKLNRTAVAVLIAVGVLIIAGLAAGYYYLSHKDPAKYEAAGDKALAAGKLEDAQEQYGLAIRRTDKEDLAGEEGIRRRFKYANVSLRMANEIEDLSLFKRNELRGAHGIARLQSIIIDSPEHMEARKRLLQAVWPEYLDRLGEVGNIDIYYDEALEVLEQNPDQADIQHRFARSAAIKATKVPDPKKYDAEARKAFAKAIELKPDDYRIWANAAQHELNMQRYGQAIDLMEKAQQQLENSAGIHVRYAELLRQLARTEQQVLTQVQLRRRIQEQYEKAAAYEPEDFLVLLHMGVFHRQQGEIEKASELYRQAARMEPTSYRPWIELARIRASQEDNQTTAQKYENYIATLDEGVQSIQALLESKQLDIIRKQIAQRSVQNLHKELANAWSEMALATTDQQRSEAIANARKHMDDFKEEIPNFEFTGEDAAIPARLAWAEGDIPQAVKHFQSAFESLRSEDRKDLGRIVTLGSRLFRLHLAQQSPTKARQVMLYLRSLPKVGTSRSVLMMEAQFERVQGNSRRALQLAKAIASRWPDYSPAVEMVEQLESGGRDVIRQAQDLLEDQKQEEAVALLEEAYQQDPSQRAVFVVLQQIYSRTGQKEKLLALIDRAIQANPDDSRLKVLRRISEDPDREKLYEYQLEDLTQRARQSEDPEEKLQLDLQRYQLFKVFKKTEKAQELLAQLQQQAPENTKVIEVSLQDALDRRDWQEAMEWSEKAQQAQTLNNRGQVAPAMVRKAQAQALLEGRPSDADKRQADQLLFQAADQFERAAREGIAPKYTLTQAGLCYLTLAQLRPEQAQSYISQADDNISKALEHDENYPDAVKTKLRLARINNDSEDVRTWLTRAHRVDPNDLRIALEWMDLQSRTADREEMIRMREDFQRRAGDNPDYAANTLRLAQLYEQAGQKEQADATYQRYFQSAPDKLQAFILVGQYLMRSGQRDKMQDLYTRFMRAAGEERDLAVRLAYVDVVRPSDPQHAQDVLNNILENPRFADRPELLEIRARTLASRGQWDQATRLLRQALDQAENEDARVGLSRTLITYQVNAGMYDEALGAIDDQPDQTPQDQAWKLIMRARVEQAQAAKARDQQQQQHVSRARELLEQAADVLPDNPGPLLALADLEEQFGEIYRAIDAVEEARSIRETPAVLFRLAQLYEAGNQLARAEALYQTQIKSDPSKEAYRNLLDLQKRRGNWTDLDQTVSEAIRVYPQDVNFILRHANSYQERMNEALKENRNRIAARYQQAMFEKLNQAVERAPESTAVRAQLLDALLASGRAGDLLEHYRSNIADHSVLARHLMAYKAAALAKTGRMDEAKETFVEAIRQAEPADLEPIVSLIARSWQDRGVMLQQLRDWVDLRKDDPYWLRLVGNAHMRSPGIDPAYARKQLEKALSLSPEGSQLQAALYQELGMALYHLGQFDASEKAYLQAIEMGNESPNLLNNLAYLYAEDKDQPAKALPYARRAARMAPDNANILDTYAWALVKTDQAQQALDPMERAIRFAQDPTPLLRYHMGLVYEKLQRYPEAQDQYTRAKNDPRIQEDPKVKSQVEQGLQRVLEKKRSSQDNS